MHQVFKKLLMFILHIVWDLLKVTNKGVSHYHAEQTLASPGQNGRGPFLSNKWKCNKKSGATAVHGSVSTSPFDS